MAKILIAFFWICLQVVYADELPECKSETDKQRGCVLHHNILELGFIPGRKEPGLKEYRYQTPYKDSLIHGVEKGYYDNGSLKKETPYKNGKKEGIQKEYDQKGILTQETSYKNDKIHGISTRYNYEGKIYSQTPYKKGEIDGVFKRYNDKGIVVEETTYKNGKKEGVSRDYDYENGKILRTERLYKDDKEVSTKEYGKNGKLIREILYNDDYKSPFLVQREYRTDGSLRRKFLHFDYNQAQTIIGHTEMFYDTNNKALAIISYGGIGCIGDNCTIEVKKCADDKPLKEVDMKDTKVDFYTQALDYIESIAFQSCGE